MDKSPDQIVDRYFELWEQQDVDGLKEIFAPDAKYIVKPFGVEEYTGIKEIQAYWQASPVGKQMSPKPRVISRAINRNIGFVEWETTFTTKTDKKKRVRGILLMVFRNGLIQELREHYDAIES